MTHTFRIEAVFEGVVDDELFNLLKTNDQFKDLGLKEAIGKLLVLEIERNRETFGTYLPGLPEVKSVSLRPREE